MPPKGLVAAPFEQQGAALEALCIVHQLHLRVLALRVGPFKAHEAAEGQPGREVIA